jgi:hypothetical protein
MKITAQPSLFDFCPASGNRLVSALAGRGWVRRRDLAPVIGLDERKIRELAEQSAGVIVSGNRGYCLFSECTVDDLSHAANRLESQGRKMIRRAIAIRNRAHKSL